MTSANFSITTAKDLVSDLNNLQIFLNCRPDGISEQCLQELAILQISLIEELDTVLSLVQRRQSVITG